MISPALQSILMTAPSDPGVYQMRGNDSSALYVGKAKNLKKRLLSYTHNEKLPHRLKKMLSEIDHIVLTVTRTEVEALLLEATLIKKLRPAYNILLKDDKSMNYIVLTDHPFPLLKKSRRPQGSLYQFGPFPSVQHIDETLISLQKAFLLRSCSDAIFNQRKRPCLQYHIKRCSAPCVQKITTQEYQGLIKEAVEVLQGHSSSIQKNLAEKMIAYSKAEDYEKARVIRDRIKGLTQIQALQTIHQADLTNADIIAIYQKNGMNCIRLVCFRHGTHHGSQSFFIASHAEVDEVLASFLEQFYTDIMPADVLFLNKPFAEKELFQAAFKEKFNKSVRFLVPRKKAHRLVVENALKNAMQDMEQKMAYQLGEEKIWQELKDFFHLPQVPQYIEVYDNSHLSGSHPISAVIGVTQEGFQKRKYRLFSPGNFCQDDYHMMKEVMIKRSKMGAWPDLIIIDGGKGQITSAAQGIKDRGISDAQMPTIIGMAKGRDRKSDVFYRLYETEPLVLVTDSPLLYMLQRIRDEAHRFAVKSHRRKRDRSLLVSKLEHIESIGLKRRKALLMHFGTLQDIANADIVELEKVSGISKELARKVYEFFRNNA